MGSNARTGSARYADRFITFSGMIREAHRLAGDDVFIREWEPDILREGWGRVYLGLSSPAYIGSDRIFGVLLALSELRDGPDHDPRLRFFIDSPDLRVLRNAITSVANDPTKLFAPFNVKRKHFHLVTDDQKSRARVVRGLDILTAEKQAWPLTYIPAFRWGSEAVLSRPLLPAQRESVRAVDPTALVPVDALVEAADSTPVSPALVPRDPFWLAESPKHDPWTKSTHVVAPILSVNVGSDAARLSLYRQAIGVLEAPLSSAGPGWWSPRMLMAAYAKTYYATEWRGLRHMDHNAPYVQALPAAYEELNELERSVLVAYQKDALLRSVDSVRTAQEALHVSV